MTKSPKRIHFIASGGSVMHGLAIDLKLAGNDVSGSDDHFFDPSKSKLAAHGLLPDNEGWHPELITSDIDFVILGMHAKKDNPELLKAQTLGLKIFSFPEYVYEASKEKLRVVIAGSHGKTTITSMIMHILRENGRDFDYMVGARLEGFDNMVKLSDAPVIIIEGDEYTTSPIDLSPKFLHYRQSIALISGIAWDHYNVYPTLDDYVRQFSLFVDATPENGFLTYSEDDTLVRKVMAENERTDIDKAPYTAHPHKVENGLTYLISPDGTEVPVAIFGDHNMQNLQGAYLLLMQMGITDEEFYSAIATFQGAAKRMQVIGQNDRTIVYLDFAHAPSKLRATATAIKTQFTNRQLVACLELHTFSSLNKAFIDQYADTFNGPDEGIIFIDPAAAARKGLEKLSESELRSAFKRKDLVLFNDSARLHAHLSSKDWTDKNLLFMSSGNFGGMDLQGLQQEILDINH